MRLNNQLPYITLCREIAEHDQSVVNTLREFEYLRGKKDAFKEIEAKLKSELE